MRCDWWTKKYVKITCHFWHSRAHIWWDFSRHIFHFRFLSSSRHFVFKLKVTQSIFVLLLLSSFWFLHSKKSSSKTHRLEHSIRLILHFLVSASVSFFEKESLKSSQCLKLKRKAFSNTVMAKCDHVSKAPFMIKYLKKTKKKQHLLSFLSSCSLLIVSSEDSTPFWFFIYVLMNAKGIGQKSTN